MATHRCIWPQFCRAMPTTYTHA